MIFCFRLCWVFIATRTFLSCGGGCPSAAAVHGLLIVGGPLAAEDGLRDVQASAVAAPGLQGTGSVLGVLRSSCSTAGRIFPDQGLNPRLLRWQVDSSPLNLQGSLRICIFTTSQETCVGQPGGP